MGFRRELGLSTWPYRRRYKYAMLIHTDVEVPVYLEQAEEEAEQQGRHGRAVPPS